MKIELEGLTKRISGTGNFIMIDNNKCNKCGRCLIVCVMNLWREKEKKIYISSDYQSKCLECAACYQVCDAGAIDFRYPAGGTGIVYKQG